MARVEVSRKNESESAAANKSRSNNMKVPFGKAEYWNVQIYGIITLQLGDKLPTDKGNHVCLLLLFLPPSLLHEDFIISTKRSHEKVSQQLTKWLLVEPRVCQLQLLASFFNHTELRMHSCLCIWWALSKKEKSPPHKEGHNYELTKTGWESSVFFMFLHASFYISYKRNAEFLLHRNLNSLICLLDEVDYSPLILFSDADRSEEQSHVRF